MTERVVLTIDPALQFGAVCIPGTRIPAESIAQMVSAGDGVDDTAAAYEITRVEVLTACWWYADWHLRSLARPKKWERSVLAAWDEWSLTALRTLAGYEGYPGPLADPPEVPR